MDNNSLHAKACVLGDKGTGKSKLIDCLDPLFLTGSRANKDAVALFNIVEFSPSELDNSDANVMLKIWEYSGKMDEVALQGSLFCIITLDIRDPETMASALTRWMAVKEKFMDECFVIIIGTFLDKSISRRVNIRDICKKCAEKDAVYIEVSGSDGTNIPLLRRMIASRINHVRRVQQEFLALGDKAFEIPPLEDDNNNNNSSGNNLNNDDNKNEDGDQIPLDAPFLEHDILVDSVGSILASCIGTEYWPGMENEREALMKTAGQVHDLVLRLGFGEDDKLPKQPLEFNIGTAPVQSRPTTQQSLSSDKEDIPDMEELKDAFDIMGFTLPPSLGGPPISMNENYKRNSEYTINVTLPDASRLKFVLDTENNVMDQIVSFCERNQLKNPELRAALMDSASNAVSALPKTMTKPGQMESIEDIIKSTKMGNEIELNLVNNNNDNQDSKSRVPFGNPPQPTGIGIGLNKMERSELIHDLYPQHNNNHRHNNDNNNMRNNNNNGSYSNLNRNNSSKDHSNLPMLYKVRLQMSSGKVQEVLIRRGEQAMSVAKRIAKLYRLKHDEEQEVLKQLIKNGV